MKFIPYKLGCESFSIAENNTYIKFIKISTEAAGSKGHMYSKKMDFN